jgi:hypothetical protein
MAAANQYGPESARTQLREGSRARRMGISSVPYISAENDPAILIGAVVIGDSGFRC